MMTEHKIARLSALLAVALVVVAGALHGGAARALAQLPAGQALVWQVGGSPGSPEGLGTLFWHTPGSSPVNLSDVPDEGRGARVFACGADAVSRDGSFLMAYIGAQTGGLYRVPLEPGVSGTLTRWGSVMVLACNGRGRAGFSPDGTRWAYLDYPPRANENAFAAGTLRVLNATDGSQVASFDEVVAFDLRNEGAYFVQFYTDPQGLADEAAVSWWDGSGLREMQSLAPEEGCDWRSAALDSLPGGDRAVLSLGEHCDRGSQWRVFSLARDGSVAEHVYMPSGGAYLTQDYANQIYALPDGTHALATFPQGRAGNITNLVLVALDQNAVTLITPEVTVDAFPNGNASHLRLSPDGSQVAYISSTANNEFTIHRLALDGSTTPLSISAGERGEAISTFFFRPDGGLLFVSGGVDGGDNVLWLLPAGAEEPQRVTRGRFLRDAGVATNEVALLMEYVPADDNYRDPATNLVAVALNNGSKTVLVDGRQAQAWAYPLAWR